MTTRGVGLFPTEPITRLVQLARKAEENDYSHVWLGDSQNIWREAYIGLGAIAQATDKIILGTGVTNPVTRHRSVLASAWATLAEMTGGRVALGIGPGDSSLRTMGLRPMKLKELKASIEQLRGLFRTESVEETDSHANFRLAYLPRPVEVPVYIACTAPRILELAGEIADGVILLVGTARPLIEAALERVDEGARKVGRSIDDLHLVLWTPTAIDSDGTKARDLVRSHVARAVNRPLAVPLAPDLEKAVERIRETYDYYKHMDVSAEHADLVPDELVDLFSLAGTPDECRDRLNEIGASGIDQISIVPFTAPGGDRGSTIEAFARIHEISD